MLQICFNGQFLNADAPVFTASNRGFRYGDGLFETIKFYRGESLLFSLHLQRLQNGLAQLGMDAHFFNAGKIREEITALCGQNGCSNQARVRWAVYRQDDGTPGYVLEASALGKEAFRWQERGWTLRLYKANQKPCGPLSNVKSANYLLYLLAAAEAEKLGVDECLVLNTEGNICDGARTNIFLVKDGMVRTPTLHQGCVAGVMRRHILDAGLHLPISEACLSLNDLLAADEVFLTNAIQGIRWVGQFGNKTYDCNVSRQIFRQLLAPVYQ